MDWGVIIRAADGAPTALKRTAEEKWVRDAAVDAALLLLDDAPHAAAAPVGAGIAALDGHGPLLAAALTPHVASALAAWRAEPDWAARDIGIRTPYLLIFGVAHLIAALRDDPAALRDAVGIVARNGDANDIAACLAALGGDGWGLLADEERGALWTRAWQDRPAAIGCVWPALTAAQQAETTQQAERGPILAAALIGSIGPSAWEATDAVLRERLIDAAARAPRFIHRCAPAWTGMSDAERAHLVTPVVDDGEPRGACRLLTALGVDGRRTLSDAQRGALDALATPIDPWSPSLLRVDAVGLRLAVAGWDALSDAERRTLMARATTGPRSAAAMIRDGGIDGRRAPPPDVPNACRAATQQDADEIFRCPSALWVDLSDGRPLPSVSSAEWRHVDPWPPEFADADLHHLPPEHQALGLARAQWRGADCVSSAPRMARLLAAWNAMTPAARVDLARAQSWTLAVVAAASRLAAREPAISETSRPATAAVVETLAVMTLRVGPECGTRGVIGRLLAAGARRRPWMRACAPTESDPSNVWNPWLAPGPRHRSALDGARRAQRSATPFPLNGRRKTHGLAVDHPRRRRRTGGDEGFDADG